MGNRQVANNSSPRYLRTSPQQIKLLEEGVTALHVVQVQSNPKVGTFVRFNNMIEPTFVVEEVKPYHRPANLYDSADVEQLHPTETREKAIQLLGRILVPHMPCAVLRLKKLEPLKPVVAIVKTK